MRPDPLPAPADSRSSGGSRRVGLVSFSAIGDDPRVRRQGDAFARAGWKVFAAGLGDARSSPPDWEIVDLRAHLSEADRHRADRTSRRRRVLNAIRRALVALGRRPAEDVYWTLDPLYRHAYQILRARPVDLWLANDWSTLPIVRRLAREQRVPFVYDTHELATDEYGQRAIWRYLHRPLVTELERAGSSAAALVTCVSEGIADRLQQLHALQRRPAVIRNVPGFAPRSFRPTGETVEVLYHGVVAPGRGLEETIRSVPMWRPEFRLVIRGPCSGDYRTALDREIRKAGVEQRITIEPPVPMAALIEAAAGHDVGLFALPGHSLHNVHALPNKLFEYIMAGLALCVADLPEMSRLTRRHDLGVLIPSATAGSIAAAVNSLSRESIDRFKRNALAAARELNWERESAALVDACEVLVSSRRFDPGAAFY